MIDSLRYLGKSRQYSAQGHEVETGRDVCLAIELPDAGLTNQD